ncbi:MAG: sigma 54-interacting transcriptional regulator [Spirochaetaceae bacterium]|jgi:Nif-specific regulatory protein|nr:sigma 54-interacting transcriptional regulator [Spirochaetaceae bacterium]
MDQTIPLKSGDRAELELLFDVARTLDKHVELRVALGPILTMIKIRWGLKNGMATLLNRATGLLKIEEAEGLTEEEKERGLYRLGEGLVGRVFETDAPIASKDLSRETHFLNRAKNRSREDMAGMSYICVPIRSGGAVIGTLSAERRFAEPHGEGEKQMANDKSFLEKVASLIADSAKLRERIMEEQFRLRRGGEAAGAKREPHGCDIFGRIARGSGIIGTSNALRDAYEMLKQVAPSDATVLISGESGTGKELIAAEIFRLSRRAGGPFLKLNCAALPESIIESELFGHEKGAFTGAVVQRKGRFELAHRGTIFLDEIGDLPPQVQVKLLRVLQERELERVGGAQTLKVDVRLIAASNKDLEKETREGRFREDLFYRLNVFPLQLPPLRERKGDIMLLADHFTEKYAEKNGKLIKRISAPAIDLLTSHTWPGNVRELENCIERAVILSTDMVIHAHNLPPSLQTAISTNTHPNATLQSALSRLEKEMILETLKTTHGNIHAAALNLGLTDRQMGLRLHHYAINWRAFRKPTV